MRSPAGDGIFFLNANLPTSDGCAVESSQQKSESPGIPGRAFVVPKNKKQKQNPGVGAWVNQHHPATLAQRRAPESGQIWVQVLGVSKPHLFNTIGNIAPGKTKCSTHALLHNYNALHWCYIWRTPTCECIYGVGYLTRCQCCNILIGANVNVSMGACHG